MVEIESEWNRIERVQVLAHTHTPESESERELQTHQNVRVVTIGV
jgi:hypothetical protein